MFNVLIVADYAASYAGNFIPSLLALEKEIKRNNGNVFYLFPEDANQYEWTNEIGNIEFVQWKKKKLYGAIRQCVKNNNIDIIHAHMIQWKDAAVIRIAGVGKKYVWHFHNHIIINQKASKMSQIIKKILLRGIYVNSKKIGVSKDVATNVESILKDNHHTSAILNAIELSRLSEVNEQTYIPKKENNSIHCLILGNHYERKGVDLAVKAVKSLSEKGRNVVLYVAASQAPGIEDFLNKIVGENVADCKYLFLIPTRNDIASYYKNIDCMLAPSREEGFNYAAAEAAYCGCSVILSKIPGQRENIVPSFIWIDDPNKVSEDTIIKQLVEAIQSSRNTTNMDGIASWIASNYSLENWAKKVYEVYLG